MPTWGEILGEVTESARARGGQPDWDGIRRKYVTALHALTERDTVLYYTDWMGSAGKANVSIVLEDMQGMMEVNKDLHGPELDLILHSPGGSAEATASVVRYLRTKFSAIRVFVPLAAMSAATMWALAGDEIVMGKHSQLGPIDPQMVTPQGQYPARAILEQFDRAKKEIAADPAVLGAWVPILQAYGPSLLQECERADLLARGLVQQWLESYMLRSDRRRRRKAADIAQWFAEYGANQSHALGIGRDEARAHGVHIVDLEADQALQDAVLSVHHATMHTFQGAAAKIVENHLGRAWVQLAQVIQVQVPLVRPGPGQGVGPVVPPGPIIP
jgi:hypothetical protein